MYILFSAIIFIISPLLLYTYGSPKVIGENIIDNYKQFRTLNSIVGGKYKGIVNILCISCMLIYQSILYRITQKLNKTVVKKGKKYEITYYINGSRYKMLVNQRKGPKDVLQVIGNKNMIDDDVSHMVEPYIGPHYDFHGGNFTPSFFEQDKLTFLMADGEDLSFNKDEKIVLAID
jgi:hypothetical protein